MDYSDITTVQREVCEMARDLANVRARQELLSGEYGLGDLLATIKHSNIEILKMTWSPFDIYEYVPSGFGLKMAVERDPLMKSAMIDTGTYEQARIIATESLQEAMVDSEDFLSSLLNDLVSPDSYYRKHVDVRLEP